YEEPDLSKTVQVAPDGTVTYPLIGTIKAAGLTVQQFEKKMIELLGSDYLVNPQVTILVKNYADISIFGQVNKPGSYEMRGSLTLTQAIALAGGFTSVADTTRVKVVRVSDEKKDTMEVDVEQILNKSAVDMEIKGNDTLIVDAVGQVFIFGQVAKPGSYDMKGNLTVTQAIAMAGGFTDTADTTKVKINRVTKGKKESFEVNVEQILNKAAADVEVKGSDTIIVDPAGQIFVMGQVNKPGVLNWRKGVTILEIIAEAGGFTDTAAPNSTRVIRLKYGRKRVIHIPVGTLLKGTSYRSRNILLEPGDTVVVPESFF
ncbi:MAG: SLBB domain-containing protein, partial [Candidatus Omnitrophica bacterium]|nr:SLBB domain-containing protein [Candidatus Omnitrophota bacterium]